MSLVNRVVAVLGLLGLTVCAGGSVVAFLAPLLWRPVRERWESIVLALLRLPETLPLVQRGLAALVAALVALLAFRLLMQALRTTEREETVQLRATDGSQTVVTLNAIVERLRHALGRVEDVVRVEPRVRGRASGLTVYLHVTTKPYIDIPLKADELRAVTREVVEKQMGMVLKQALVKIDHEGFGESLSSRRF